MLQFWPEIILLLSFFAVLAGALGLVGVSPGAETLTLMAALDPAGVPPWAQGSLLSWAYPWVWPAKLLSQWFNALGLQGLGALWAVRLPNLMALLGALAGGYTWILLLTGKRTKALIAMVLLMLSWGVVSAGRTADLTAPGLACWLWLGVAVTALAQTSQGRLSLWQGLGFGFLLGATGLFCGWPVMLIGVLTACALWQQLKQTMRHSSTADLSGLVGYLLLGSALVLVCWLPVTALSVKAFKPWLSWPASVWEYIWLLRDLMPALLFLPAALHRSAAAGNTPMRKNRQNSLEPAYGALMAWLLPSCLFAVMLSVFGVSVPLFVVFSPWILWASLYISDLLGGDYMPEVRRWHAITLEGWILVSLSGLLGLSWLLFTDLPDRYLGGVPWWMPGPDALPVFFDAETFIPLWKLWLLPGLLLVLLGVLMVLIFSALRRFNEALIAQGITVAVLTVWMLYGVLPVVSPAVQSYWGQQLLKAPQPQIAMSQTPELGLSAWLAPTHAKLNWQKNMPCGLKHPNPNTTTNASNATESDVSKPEQHLEQSLEQSVQTVQARPPVAPVAPQHSLLIQERDYYDLPYETRQHYTVLQAFTQWRISPLWQVILNRSSVIASPHQIKRKKTVLLTTSALTRAE
ncbi:MAG: hypothetical protein VKJ06_06315 [Vampirovibrionales bacterium]|nr:hypothetical protein [Vampirovibrionales bacterium]